MYERKLQYPNSNSKYPNSGNKILFPTIKWEPVSNRHSQLGNKYSLELLRRMYKFVIVNFILNLNKVIFIFSEPVSPLLFL